MAWQVYCKHCQLLFTIVEKTIIADQSTAGANKLLLTCQHCGQSYLYTAQDIIPGTPTRDWPKSG